MVKKAKQKRSIDYSKPLKNAKHERFSQVWVKDAKAALNNTLSYQIAYPLASEEAAAVGGCRLLTNAKIAGRIAYLQAELAKEMGVTAIRLMEEWKKIGFSNIDDYLRIDDEGCVIGKDFSTINRSKLAAIESIKQTVNITSNKNGEKEYETRNFTFKLHDKTKAIIEMGKHIGFYEKDNEQRQQAPQTLVIERPEGLK